MAEQTCLACGGTRDLNREQRAADLEAEMRRQLAAQLRRAERAEGWREDAEAYRLVREEVVLRLIPEEYDGEAAEESILIDWIRDVVRERAEAQAALAQVEAVIDQAEAQYAAHTGNPASATVGTADLRAALPPAPQQDRSATA